MSSVRRKNCEIEVNFDPDVAIREIMLVHGKDDLMDFVESEVGDDWLEDWAKDQYTLISE